MMVNGYEAAKDCNCHFPIKAAWDVTFKGVEFYRVEKNGPTKTQFVNTVSMALILYFKPTMHILKWCHKSEAFHPQRPHATRAFKFKLTCT